MGAAQEVIDVQDNDITAFLYGDSNVQDMEGPPIITDNDVFGTPKDDAFASDPELSSNVISTLDDDGIKKFASHAPGLPTSAEDVFDVQTTNDEMPSTGDDDVFGIEEDVDTLPTSTEDVFDVQTTNDDMASTGDDDVFGTEEDVDTLPT